MTKIRFKIENTGAYICFRYGDYIASVNKYGRPEIGLFLRKRHYSRTLCKSINLCSRIKHRTMLLGEYRKFKKNSCDEQLILWAEMMLSKWLKEV